MGMTTYVELVFHHDLPSNADHRRIRVYGPNTIDLDLMGEDLEELELGPTAGLVFEDRNGVALGYLLPGQRMGEVAASRLSGVKAHLFRLSGDRPAFAAAA